MISKRAFTLTAAVALTLAAVGSPETVLAGGLKLKETSQAKSVRPGQSSQRLKAETRRSKEEVLASQDFAWECNEYGGGASTDPTGVDVCTTPDGDPIIVPFP